MTTSLLFDFTVDKLTSTVYVKREFEAGQQLVWEAFTKQEILDLWWAPKPWVSKTRYMNFAVGGRRVYAMCGPGGEEFWSVQQYTDITPIANFKQISLFTDKDENINNVFSPAEWNLDFSEAEGITTVSIAINHKTPDALEKMAKMGFQGGFTMTLNYLSELLNMLKK